VRRRVLLLPFSPGERRRRRRRRRLLRRRILEGASPSYRRRGARLSWNQPSQPAASQSSSEPHIEKTNLIFYVIVTMGVNKAALTAPGGLVKLVALVRNDFENSTLHEFLAS